MKQVRDERVVPLTGFSALYTCAHGLCCRKMISAHEKTSTPLSSFSSAKADTYESDENNGSEDKAIHWCEEACNRTCKVKSHLNATSNANLRPTTTTNRPTTTSTKLSHEVEKRPKSKSPNRAPTGMPQRLVERLYTTSTTSRQNKVPLKSARFEGDHSRRTQLQSLTFR